MSTFAIGDEHFELDGEPFRVLAGALHYFRVHPDSWADSIRKARLMGLNTIETYVPWSLHEPAAGEWTATGQLDLERFLRAVATEGLHAIVRPGPYICAEFDNGGLPAWLFRDPAVGIRRSEPIYLAAVQSYLERVLAVVAPLQVENGGPVILVQIENEYGAYGDDAEYLRTLVRITRDTGITVPLTTVDQPQPDMLENGSLPELHKTASFGSRSAERLAILREHQPTGPLMCSEFWNGWFDHWGAHHHTTSVAASAADLDELLALGASVTLYMFHGGTNFGFTNGANDKGVYQPTVTSYDYDAPLDEAGDPTAKYWAFRDVIAKYAPVPDEVPDAAADAPVFSAPFGESVALLDVVDSLGEWTSASAPPTFDSVGHYSGFALYRADGVSADDVAAGPAVLEFVEVRDRAQVFVDGRPAGLLSRDHHDRSITLPAVHESLQLLVEDQGRVNYGERIGEPKGLIGPARLAGEPLEGWSILPIDLGETGFATVSAALDARRADAAASTWTGTGPSFARARFTVETPTALFLETRHWGKGIAWVNGFSLGRYWTRGPQHTLFVPAPLLRAGENELVILELEGATAPEARFVAGLDLGHEEF